MKCELITKEGVTVKNINPYFTRPGNIILRDRAGFVWGVTDGMHRELFEHCWDWCFDNDIPYFYFKDLIKGKLYLLKSKGVDVSIEKMIGLADECMKKIRMGSEEHKNRGDF